MKKSGSRAEPRLDQQFKAKRPRGSSSSTAPKPAAPPQTAAEPVAAAPCIEKPPSLAVGTSVEALDDSDLWYPAHVADVN